MHTLAIAAVLLSAPMTLAQPPAATPEPPSAQPQAPKRIEGPGLIRAVHLLNAGDDASDLKQLMQRRSAELAGVTHEYLTDSQDFTKLAGGDTHGAAKGKSRIVLLSHDGTRLAQLDLGLTDPSAFDRLSKLVAERSITPAVKDYNLDKAKLALQGYDTVAYFTQKKAVKGDPAITSTFTGVTYRFATEANRDRFAQDPLRYLPTYGGWCASAMGDGGRKVEIEPANFKVKDGRLFLFYKGVFADARKDWDKNEKKWEPAADDYWRKIAGEAAIKP